MKRIRPVIVITHAVFDADRRRTLARLLDQLQAEGDKIPVHVTEDTDRAGSLDCWRRAMEMGLCFDATHVVWLGDDVTVCKNFGRTLRRAIAAQPLQVFDCYVNQENVAAPGGWYTTHDGYVGGAGVMPRELLEEHLAWRAQRMGFEPKGDPSYLGNDEGVNLWAMATGRLIWKTARSLIDHDDTVPSLEGNAGHDFRRSARYLADGDHLQGLDDQPVHVGRTYVNNHWAPIFKQDVWGPWDLEASYVVERGGAPVSAKPHVLIATPAYTSPELGHLVSVRHTIADLEAHGVEVTWYMSPGDSLVTRGRHCLQHAFLASTATHLLQWDADLECLDPQAVRAMLASGHDVVGGAYPWRDGSGNVCANRLPPPKPGEPPVRIDRHHCIPVAEVGTGFLLTSRRVIVDLCTRHPELLYECDLEGMGGCPMWALFDVLLEMRPHGRRRYASEDWRFCSLAREAGYGVFVYYPPLFHHWGKAPSQGHVVKAWGLGQPLPEAKEAAE